MSLVQVAKDLESETKHPSEMCLSDCTVLEKVGISTTITVLRTT